MAEYSERTGGLKWQRVVLATQREMIEKWLRQHYPVQDAVAAAPEFDRGGKPAARARAVTSKGSSCGAD